MGGVIGASSPPSRRMGARWILSSAVIGIVAGSPPLGARADADAGDAATTAPPSLSASQTTRPAAPTPGAEAPAPPRAGWSFAATGGLDLAYTDNVYLTDTGRRADFIVAPRGSLDAVHRSPRSLFSADVDIVYDYYARNTRLNGARPRAILDGLAEVLDETLTVEGTLATDVQQISSKDRFPAIERNLDRNQTQVLNYRLSPTLRGRAGSLAAQASYSWSSVNFLDPPVGDLPMQGGDMQRHFARAEAGSADPESATLAWTASGSFERAQLEGRPEQPDRANAEAKLQHWISGSTALSVRGGRDWIDEATLAAEPDGAYGLAGVVWRPSQRTRARFEAGYRYGDFNAEAELYHEASNAIILAASYFRDIQNTQRVLLTNLESLGRDDLGNLVDPITGLPADPNAITFDLTNQAFTRDRYRAGAHGRLGRNFYSVSADHERRTADMLTGRSWTGVATLGRDLTPRTQGSVTGSHQREKSDPGLSLDVRDTTTTTASARLDYALTRVSRASLRYVHMRRATTLARYRENAIVLSFSTTF